MSTKVNNRQRRERLYRTAQYYDRLPSYYRKTNADFHYFMELAGWYRRQYGNMAMTRYYLGRANECRVITRCMVP